MIVFAVALLLSVTISTAISLINGLAGSHGSGFEIVEGIGHTGPQQHVRGLDIIDSRELRNTKTTTQISSNEYQDVTSLALRSPSRPFPHSLWDSLSPRRISSIGNYSWRVISYNVIEPVAAELRGLQEDLDQAYASYKRSLEWIRADHAPFTKVSLTLGAYKLNISSPNPLYLDIVKEAVGLAVFAAKMFSAAYIKLVVISLPGVPYTVAFGVIALRWNQGNQHAIPNGI
ncbi:MAG: hypothetical protein LQ350_003058 [Teloschistes chrysophthalmus]|nr:MAG: hypothetical protein LQ350_003058 [Niorma chrysophthalma]